MQAPPARTAGSAPIQAATAPARKSPNSLDAPTNSMCTALTRPRMSSGVAIFGAAVLVFGMSGSFALSIAALAVMGAADMLSVWVRSTIVQLATPDGMRGRVSAVHMLFVGTSNELGDFRAGMVAAWLGALPAVMAGGVCTLLVTALWARFFPELRRIDRLAEVRS